jgi:NADP-dependent 3-hydroxy acid dehydrogenase YdfG
MTSAQIAPFFTTMTLYLRMSLPTHSERVWFITGAASGLGRALAEKVIAAGEKVIATARRTTALESLVALAPDRVETMALDVTQLTRIPPVMETALARWGRLDVIVNNAGRGWLSAIEESTTDATINIMMTNFMGPLEIMKAALPHLRAQGHGHFINISAAATTGNYPGFGVYGASKAALEAASESLRQEIQPLGLHLTLVQPGPFRTGFVTHAQARPEPIAAYEATVGKFGSILEKTNGRQPGDPAKAAKAIYQASLEPSPPLRLLLGQYMVKKARHQLSTRLKEIEALETKTIPTEFDA